MYKNNPNERLPFIENTNIMIIWVKDYYLNRHFIAIVTKYKQSDITLNIANHNKKLILQD